MKSIVIILKFSIQFMFFIESEHNYLGNPHENGTLAISIGIATSNVNGPYCAAPLHPSVLQVAQNSVLISDDVLLLVHSSFGACWSSQTQDRLIIFNPFTVELNSARKK